MRIKPIYACLATLLIVFSIMGCSQSAQVSDKPVEDGLVISTISSGLGGQPDKSLLTYEVNLWNRTNKPIYIRLIEPIINKEIKKRLLDKQVTIQVNKEIEPNSVEKITGKYEFNTQGLSKDEIMKLNPNVKTFKIVTEQVVGIKIN